jgi:hypothetical protein
VNIPIDRLLGLARIAGHTEEMSGHTARLEQIAEGMDSVAKDTQALPQLGKEMSNVADATAVLAPMDARMAKIEEAMPVLVEVQRHLSQVPETLQSLEGRQPLRAARAPARVDGRAVGQRRRAAGVGAPAGAHRRTPARSVSR